MTQQNRERYQGRTGQYRRESRPYAGLGPRGYRRKDERIFEDVCERLTRHGKIDASRIRVDVRDGQVIFSGKVPDRQTKYMVEDVAERVSGVMDVQNQLRVEQTARGQQQSGRYRFETDQVEEVGDTGIYPASGPMPKGDAEVRAMGELGHPEQVEEKEPTPGKQGRGSRSRKQQQ